jgi:hypothetical protein
MSLSPEQISELLNLSKVLEREHAIPNEQKGPLRWFDREMRCTSRRCSSPTYSKVNGIPLCQMHALQKLNELLITTTVGE